MSADPLRPARDQSSEDALHVKRVGDLERDYRNQRARDRGIELVRRATDAKQMTNVDEEHAVALRAMRLRSPDSKAWPMTGDQVVTGLYEPVFPILRRASRWERLRKAARRCWLSITSGAA